MRTLAIVVFASYLAPFALQADPGVGGELSFEKHAIWHGRGESCAVADVNGDGTLDILSADAWFEGPTWERHVYRELGFFNNYIDTFSDLPLDVNGDGAIDVVTATWGERVLAWWENPGDGDGKWAKRIFHQGSPVEFAFLVDLDNDGQANEVLPQFGGKKGGTAWFSLAKGGFRKHTVHPETFGHGIGAGDVNADGRTDVLVPKGWIESPAPGGEWTYHAEFDLEKHAGFIHVWDVDGDGLQDIVTTRAHDYGIVWLKQALEGGTRSWTLNVIDDAWSQAHAMTAVDLTGDGRLELVTGKRLYAHNGHDPGGRETLGVYWYEQVELKGKVAWARHILDYGGRTGGGMQIPVADLDGDGDLDILVAGKGGLFWFENKTTNE